MVEMNSSLWGPILRYATPLLMNRTPVSTVALQHKFVSSVLRATPLPIKQNPVSTVGAPTVVCFLRFAVRHTPPDQQDPISTICGRTQVHFLHFAVGQTLPDEQDPVSTVRG